MHRTQSGISPSASAPCGKPQTCLSANLPSSTGIAPDTVMEYETGEHDIPVSFLFKAAQACGSDLTSLLTGGDAHLHGYALVRHGQDLQVEHREAYRYQNLAHTFANPSMEPLLVTVPPKTDAELEYIRHSGEEFLYMLRGRLEVRLGQNAVIMEPHDCLYFNSLTPHALQGLDGKEAEFSRRNHLTKKP